MGLMFRDTDFPKIVPFTIVMDAEYIWDSRLEILKGGNVAKLQALRSTPNPVLLYLVTENKKLLESGKLLTESGMRLSLIDASYWTESDLRELMSTATFTYTPFNTKVFNLAPIYLRSRCSSYDAFIEAISLFITGVVDLNNKNRQDYLL